MPGSTDPVSHLVFSDGLASVSVFVEMETKTTKETPDGEEVTEESSRVGSSSVYSTMMGGRKVTAVGEVPPATVRSIATSFSSQGTAPALVPKH
jgi:sigma-E factor negative regulatory protein RseB